MFRINLLFLLIFSLTVNGLKTPVARILNENKDPNDEANSEVIYYRLPTNVRPSKYDILLTPYFDGENKFKFDGNVDITISVLENVKNITLHAKDLFITKLSLKGVEIKEVDDINYKLDEETNFLIIQRKENKTIEKGDYTLTIKYIGILNNEMRGFYRSSYINEEGKRIWLATTHFEPVDARRAFPCFDEPFFKANFVIRIIHDKNYTAFSNMPIDSESQKSGDLLQTNFQETPKMSTYLVAFVVSDFKNISNPANFTVAARSNAIQNGYLALNSGLKLLKALEDFTQVNFEMGKMDQIAIPDFSAGAMENWGLVLYREHSLLFDNKTMTTEEKQNIVETIAHEFAHQWFGNIISPKWWKYIWLNEGFANFFQSYITDKVEPEWRSVEQAVVKSIQTTSFDFDCESETHPINHDVEKPDEIRKLFDTISYKKGGAVIRMMQHFLTDKIFQKGLHNYLTKSKLKHNVAVSDDLFDAIQEIVNQEKIENLYIKTIMNSWVESKGYPVVNVKRNNETKNIEVSQERFYTYEPTEEEKKINHTWYIPINYATKDNLDFKNTTAEFWLNSSSEKLPITIDSENFIILNKQHTGYYRVQYDNENWNLIIKHLNANHSDIHVLNRAQMINDALAFSKQKKLDVSILLKLMNHLQNETDYIAWYPGFKAFSWLKSKLIHTNNYPQFKNFASKRMKSLIEHVGLEETPEEKEKEYLTKLNRITAMDWDCEIDVQMNKTCVEKAKKKLELWLEDSNKNFIVPNLLQVTLCAGLRDANYETWRKALEKSVSNTTKDVEKKKLFTALTCTSNKTTLEYYFNYTYEENSPLENETLNIVELIHKNSDVGVDVALHLIIDRLAAILIKTRINKISDILFEVSEKITTTDQLKKLESAKSSDIPKKTVLPAIELAKKNIEWLKENEAVIKSTIDQMDNSNSGVNIFAASVTLISSVIVLVFTTAY